MDLGRTEGEHDGREGGKFGALKNGLTINHLARMALEIAARIAKKEAIAMDRTAIAFDPFASLRRRRGAGDTRLV
jgi:hypothetical protein